MRAVTREELKRRLERGDSLALLAVLTAWQFRLGRIPGSTRFTTLGKVKETFPSSVELVVYCQGYPSLNSEWAYRLLLESGFTNLHLYPGGLTEWRAAGYPLVSE